jgi:hypothetical protein
MLATFFLTQRRKDTKFFIKQRGNNWKILSTIKPLNSKPAKRFNFNLFHAKFAKEQRRKGTKVLYKTKSLINGKYFQPFEPIEPFEPVEPVFQKRKLHPTIKPKNFKPEKRLELNLFHSKLAKEQRRKVMKVFYKTKSLINGKYF